MSMLPMIHYMASRKDGFFTGTITTIVICRCIFFAEISFW